MTAVIQTLDVNSNCSSQIFPFMMALPNNFVKLVPNKFCIDYNAPGKKKKLTYIIIFIVILLRMILFTL